MGSSKYIFVNTLLRRQAVNRIGIRSVTVAMLLSYGLSAAHAENFGFPSAETQTDQKTPFEFEYFEELLNTVPEKERERLCGLDKVCVELWRKGKLQIYKEGRLIEGDFNEDGITEQAMILETDSESEAEAGMGRKDYWIYISQPEDDKTADSKSDTAALNLTPAETGGSSTGLAKETGAVSTVQMNLPARSSGAKTATIDSTSPAAAKPSTAESASTAAASPAARSSAAESPKTEANKSLSGAAPAALPERLVKGHKVLLHEILPDAFNVIDFFWDPKRKGLVIDVGERIMRAGGMGVLDDGLRAAVVQPGHSEKVIVVVTWNPKTSKYDVLVPLKGFKHRKRNA